MNTQRSKRGNQSSSRNQGVARQLFKDEKHQRTVDEQIREMKANQQAGNVVRRYSVRLQERTAKAASQ